MTSLSHSSSRLLVWLLACCAFDSPGRLELQVNLSQKDSCLWGIAVHYYWSFPSFDHFDYVHLLSSSSTYYPLPITARGRQVVYLAPTLRRRFASPTLSTIRPAPLTTKVVDESHGQYGRTRSYPAQLQATRSRNGIRPFCCPFLW